MLYARAARDSSGWLRAGRAALAALLAWAAVWPPAARAEPALTIVSDAGGAAVELALADLEAMPQATIVTENAFIDGRAVYRGPLMRDIIARTPLGDAGVLRFTAANDYYIDIPVSDFHDYDVILAMEADGARLTRRERGPLWLMYPVSDHPELRDPIYVHRLIWQVIRIERL